MIGISSRQKDDLLTHDHSEIDALVGKIAGLFSLGKPKPILEAIDLFWDHLAVHIRAEHLYLFPALTEESSLLKAAEAAAILNRIEDLHEDHNFFMREVIGAIKTMRRIVMDSDSDELSRLVEAKERIESVHRRLIVHNVKEESEIYPLVDRLVAPDAAIMLRTKMKRELDNLPPRFVVTPN
ncbi:MAG: hemerythrin domain-containing protein [Acidobacteriota bacterium]